MKGSAENSRRDARMPLACPVCYVVMGDFIHPPEAADIEAEIRDVSESGMKIRITGKPPKAGSVLCVRVPITTAGNVQVTVPVLTQVRWVGKAAREARHAGVSFMV